MWPALCIVAGLVVALPLLRFLLLWRLRRTIRHAGSEMVKVTVEEVPGLAEECVRLFNAKFGKQLSLDDLERSAWLLDEYFRDGQIRRAFGSLGSWDFVNPVGAFVGELLRRHYGYEWRKQAERPPYLHRTTVQQLEVTTLPFEKVFKYGANRREKGDFYTYLKADQGIGPAAESAGVR
jgi:hypothetical protein